jgi:glutamine synthetase
MAHDLPRVGVAQGFEPDRAKVAAVEQRLRKAGVRTCFATFVDVHGIPKAKATPIDSFSHMCEGSELYTVGACEGLGLVGPQEDDCATVPDLDSTIVMPWDKTAAWFASDLHYQGEPYAGDPRTILRRVLARAERLGLRFNLGIEPELYVLVEEPGGGLAPIGAVASFMPKPFADDFRSGAHLNMSLADHAAKRQARCRYPSPRAVWRSPSTPACVSHDRGKG